MNEEQEFVGYNDYIHNIVEADDEEQVEEEVVETSTPVADKPAYDLGPFVTLGVANGSPRVRSTGPLVDFVNDRLGVADDSFTEATSHVVKEFQQENSLPVTGKVDSATYSRL